MAIDTNSLLEQEPPGQEIFEQVSYLESQPGLPPDSLSDSYAAIARIDEIIFALASGKTLRELRTYVDMSLAVMNKQIAWYGIRAYHCLKYMGYGFTDIMGCIARDLRKLTPEISYGGAIKQAKEIHSVIEELAEGWKMLQIAQYRGWTTELLFTTISRRMAVYCLAVYGCLRELGLRRTTIHSIMATAQMGMPLMQVFLQLGMGEALLSAGSFLGAARGSLNCSFEEGGYYSKEERHYPEEEVSVLKSEWPVQEGVDSCV